MVDEFQMMTYVVAWQQLPPDGQVHRNHRILETADSDTAGILAAGNTPAAGDIPSSLGIP